ncbi:hypothetical protein JHK82_022967 [Glycine max]|uniref:MYB/HD-like transcription factor n=2 Tax=Glycine subgen. Soja TaxID=1462606 RepID=I1KXR7_SOYBN|nr:transcription factor MYB124 [Glycine max]XP_028245761.1 transcription factor MYB124-like [Glycine soja]KAG5138236.1 hypothetical protein JHK82_022967 [Glycine max]KAH1053798.1 hypothetical protein GYH30_022846 [Glycine max]KRH45873.1 hypothetical protein GLYMA_08G298200v4 [Glycine max]RZB99495.1 Transcription factor MYB88 isoform A [Glycine soja]RZB99496.1 Transcription factor MYB88 isoform B [Glycine soja]|eukprot:XP_006586015.1 transcription factor MYB124 [Glycine max]
MVQDMKQQDNGESKKKERHIVTWTQEEDDILREQIGIHGTENWAIIASKFKDKTTRQCRRRWYTYLNSDFKKGGWSAEEDMLLCEAQKVFGNRWTEIAKVVSGRTDNAVKNRFSTLCRKKQKYAALAKENSTSYINSNNKRMMLQHCNNMDTTSESGVPIKNLRRADIADDAEKIKFEDRSHLRNGTPINQQPRAPLAVLAQNCHNSNNLTDQHHLCNPKFSSSAQNNKIQGTFLKKDDPKISALMQQAELLSSLALKVDTENMDQSLENAWKVLQEFLNRSKESDIPGQKVPDVRLVDLKDMIEELKSGNEEGRVLQELLNRTKESDSTGHKIPDLRPADFKDMVEDSKSGNEEGQVLQEFLNRTNKSDIPEHKIPNLQLVDLKDMIEDLKSGNEEGQACWRKMDCYENSPGSSGYSTGSILICQSASDNLEHSLHQDIGTEMKSKQLEDEKGVKVVMPTANVDQDMVPCCMEQINNDGIVSTSSRLEFSSPLQVTPLFRSLAAGIPSPQFSESERNFLRKTLGMESPSINPSANSSQPPPCKRALLPSL